VAGVARRSAPFAALALCVLVSVPRAEGDAPQSTPCTAATEGAPHDTPQTALLLGEVADDAAFPAGTLTPTLGSGAADWFRYHVRDGYGVVAPRLELRHIPPRDDYGLCAYFTCATGEAADVVCERGVASQRDGRTGCCGANLESTPERIAFDVLCGPSSFDDDGGDVLVVVERVAGPGTCAAYELEWGDD
jgi:hypothetical protein